tara:strand:- start:976 stop:1479 length:504 start_codon:yes stop_codon:yes gene_type:complete
MGINFSSGGDQDFPAGVSQVVQDTKLDTFTTTSTSFVTITGLSASITPRSSSNKILVVVDIKGWVQNAQHGELQIRRDSTTIYTGNSSGSRNVASIGGLYEHGSPTNPIGTGFAMFLDSPSTTSSITYTIRCRTQSVNVCINRSNQDQNTSDNARMPSSITLLEVQQ